MTAAGDGSFFVLPSEMAPRAPAGTSCRKDSPIGCRSAASIGRVPCGGRHGEGPRAEAHVTDVSEKTAAATVKIRLLGGVTLSRGDLVDRVGSGRVAEFVTYMALEAPLGADAGLIAAALWPGASRVQQRTNLRHLWLTARRTYPVLAMAISRDAAEGPFRWTMPIVVDVAAWERAAASAGTSTEWTTLVAEYGDGLAARASSWARGWHDALQREAAALRRQLAVHQAARRAFAEAAETLSPAIEGHAATDGDVRTWLRYQVMGGGDPGLVRSATRLEQTPFRADRGVQAELSRLRSFETDTKADLLVGRSREWMRLTEAWERTHHGSSACVFVQGSAGLGKSTLLREWGRWVQVCGLPVIERVELLGILAEEDRDWGRQAVGGGGMPSRDRWGQYHRWLKPLTDSGPTVVLWDDLAAEDDDAWTGLAYVLRRAPRARILLCAAMRDTPGDIRRRQQFRTALHTLVPCEVVTLPPLGQEETREFVSARAPHLDVDLDALWHWSGGHPLALVTGLAAMVEGGISLDQALPSVVHQRLDGLARPLQRLLSEMALLNDARSSLFWRAVAGAPAADLGRLAADGWTVQGADGRWSLAHAEIARAIREGIVPSLRTRYARRLAETLAETPDEKDTARVADLFAVAGDIEAACLWWRRAAEASRRQLRLADARQAYEHLMQWVDGVERIRCLLDLAGTLADQGQRQEALAVYRTACTDALSAAAFPELAEARAGMARHLLATGEARTAESLLGENLAYYRQQDDQAGVARTLVQMADAANRAGRPSVAMAHASEARTAAAALGQPQLVAEAESYIGYVAWDQGEYAEAVAAWRRAEGAAMAAGDALTALRALGDIGTALLDAGDLGPAVEYQWQKALLARRHGLLEELALALGNLGVAYQDVGLWEDSDVCLAAAARLMLAQADVRNVAVLMNTLAYTYGETGHLDQAEALWTSAVEMARVLPWARSEAQFLLHWANLLLDRKPDSPRLPGLLRRAWQLRDSSPEWDRARWSALCARVLTRSKVPASRNEDVRRRLSSPDGPWKRRESRALLDYVAWDLSRTPADRNRAIKTVGSVWAEHPHVVWQRYLQALTGESPPLPRLSPVPEWVRAYGDPRDTLDEELVRFSRAFVASVEHERERDQEALSSLLSSPHSER